MEREVNADALAGFLHTYMPRCGVTPEKFRQDFDAAFPLAKPEPVPTSHTEGSAKTCEQVGETKVFDSNYVPQPIFPPAKPEPTGPVCVGPGPDNYGEGFRCDILDEPTPPGDGIDEAVYKAWWAKWCPPNDYQPYSRMTAWAKDAVDAAVHADRELRGAQHEKSAVVVSEDELVLLCRIQGIGEMRAFVEGKGVTVEDQS